MELVLYFFLAFLSLLFSLKEKIIPSERVFGLLYFVVSLVMSVVIRFRNFDVDIQTYADAMLSSSFSFYYLREPVVWIGQRYLYQILGSQEAVFILFDLIALGVLYKAFKNYRLPQYAFFSFLCFFPFILGIQNVYRQWYSVIFVLYAFSMSHENLSERYFSFLLAGLSHNVAGLFSAPFFLMSKRIWEKILGVVFVFLTPIAVLLSADTKSSASTGQNLVLAYLFLIALISGVMVIASRLKVRQHEIKGYIILLFSIYSVVTTSLLLTSTGAERTAMFALMLLYPHLILSLEWHFKQSSILRAALSVLGFFPILLFGTRQFIL
ncbi:EpsG family protein [Idiomarina abyssalis]|uniref:EpsG family protein n=1 Tax=Idiomarina abyssalis TaxID=86102 RepID=UPI001C93C61D|nr:EpsG family protein [Idiomarina abyssalis]QZN91420.1 EpsG family protein [Idiomarina abyssalis]